MSPHDVTTYREAAKIFDVDRATIRDLVRKYRLTPKAVPRSGVAKGLDAADMRVIAGALGETELVAAS